MARSFDTPSTTTGETNSEFVSRMMDYAKCGPMMQLFMIQALMTYSEHVVANEAEVVKSMEKSFISPKAWMACAKELKAELDIRCNPPQKKG